MPFPSDIMSRIIVKRSEEASFNLSCVWRYGAVLYYNNDTYALIEQKDSIIMLFVTGKNREQYHDILRGTVLDVIDKYTSFQNNMPKLSYEIIEQSGIMYPHQHLMNLYKKGQDIYDDLARDIMFSVIKNAVSYSIKNVTTVYIEKYVANSNYGDGSNIQFNQPDNGSRVDASQSIGIDVETLKTYIETAKNEVNSNFSDETTKKTISDILKELEEIRQQLLKDPSNKETKGLLKNVWSKLEILNKVVTFGAGLATLLKYIHP
jgi:hypothetical protein